MIVGALWLGVHRRVATSSVTAIAALLGYLILSLVVAGVGPCRDLFPKLLVTGPILIFLILIGLEIGNRARLKDWLNLQKAAIWGLVLAFSGFLAEAIAPSKFPNRGGFRMEGRYSGLFKEPSHVAFALFPCVAVLLVAESKKIRRGGLFALIALLIFSRSSTLLALTAAWLVYRLLVQKNRRQVVLLALGVVALIALACAIDYDRLIAPTVDRIAGVAASSGSDNMSSLLYVQGWQDAWGNLARTHGIGLGFNMMGCHPLPNVPLRDVLTTMGFDEPNAQDGTFLFAKILSEAGIGGVAFYLAIAWSWLHLEKRVRNAHDARERVMASTQAALIFCFVASSFIRSEGYFSGGLLLWVVAIPAAPHWRGSFSAKGVIAPTTPRTDVTPKARTNC